MNKNLLSEKSQLYAIDGNSWLFLAPMECNEKNTSSRLILRKFRQNGEWGRKKRKLSRKESSTKFDLQVSSQRKEE